DDFFAQSFGEIVVRPVVRAARQRQDGEADLPWPIRDRPGMIQLLDDADELIAAPRNRFDELRLLGIIPEHGAQPLHRGVQPVLEVDEGAVGPEALPQFVPQKNLARLLEQQREELEGLIGQSKARAVFAKLAASYMELEAAEAIRSIRGGL